MKNVKIGDKVVLVSEDPWSKKEGLKVGEIYTVRSVTSAFTISVVEGLHPYSISKNQFKRVVTTVDVGAKVVRGKDWSWSDQDDGSCYGIITKRDSSTGWVAIDWISDTGRVITQDYQYRIGDLNKYDLYYYDGPEVVTPEPVFVPPIVAKPEPLILDKYKIGDVVVSLAEHSPPRRVGEMFVVLPKSSRSNLYYRDDRNSTDPSSWRAATPEEAAFFHTGGKNIKDMSKELLVFGKYKVGDIVVSLTDTGHFRNEGDMYAVLEGSTSTNLLFDPTLYNNIPQQWRAATEFEAASYRTGTRNINHIVSSATSSSVPPPNPSFESLEGKYVKCIADYPSNDYTEGKYYYVHKHDKDFITIVDRAGAFTWMLDRSYNTVNNVYDLSKGYNWVTSYELDHDAFKHVGKTIPKSELPYVMGHDPYEIDRLSEPIGKPYKPDASFQVAFVDTQLHKPGKKQKIKF